MSSAAAKGPSKTVRAKNRDEWRAWLVEHHEAPPEFARALRTAPAARRSFDTLAPSYRRQYLGWIAQAKRPETRARRIAQAVERLAAGRKLFD